MGKDVVLHWNWWHYRTIIIYFVTRFSTPITEGRALRINSMGIVIEIFQFIYIGLTAYILTRQGRMTTDNQKGQLK